MRPLRSQRLEAKPKRVTFASQFTDALGAARDARFLLQFNELQDCIANGWKVPDIFYRIDVDANRDRLLEATGVKHLHLGGRGSNVLVYLIELDDRVIFLQINNHIHLEDEPRGSLLNAIFGHRG